MAVLYRDFLQMDHYAPFLSKQTFITYFFVFITFVLPLAYIIPSKSKFTPRALTERRVVRACADFWIRETVTYEQPNIQSLNEIVVALFTPEHTYILGSTEELHRLHGTKTPIAPQIKVILTPTLKLSLSRVCLGCLERCELRRFERRNRTSNLCPRHRRCADLANFGHAIAQLRLVEPSRNRLQTARGQRVPDALRLLEFQRWRLPTHVPENTIRPRRHSQASRF